MNLMTPSPLLMPRLSPENSPAQTVALPVAAQEILQIEAQSNYVLITTSRRRYFIRSSMTDCVARIPAGFGLRVHRSHWVAAAAVAGLSVSGPRMMLKLTLGKDIPVARRRKLEVSKWIRQLQTQS